MRAYPLRLLVLSSFSALFACTGELSGGSEGPAVEITVAPLTLPGVLDVQYALAVFNASPTTSTIFNADGTVIGNIGDLVWEQDSLTSTQFGNGAGGDISYVGPCDASLGGDSTNYVALALKTVTVANGQGSYPVGDMNILDDQNTVAGGDDPKSADTDADFSNPCPYDDPCVLPVPCVENQDTPVTFNLTILRDANQGFFDIAVNFDDIFCSAKVDCTYDDAGQEPITLLFDGNGDRGQTAVFGLACTQGAGGANTVLHMNGARVECGELLGEATTPRSTATTCTSDGVVYGATQGSTKQDLVTVLPVMWSDATTAAALTTNGWDGGAVLQRLDDHTLLGVVGDAVAAVGRGIDASRLNTGGSNGGTKAALANLAVAIWNRNDNASPWALTTYAMPTNYVSSSVASVFYDGDSERVWAIAGTVDGEGRTDKEVPVFFARDTVTGGWTFLSAVALSAPTNEPFCTLSEVRGNLAVGLCSETQAIAAAVSSDSKAGSGGQAQSAGANTAVMWDISGSTFEQQVLNPEISAGVNAYGITQLGILPDGTFVATAWSDATTLHGVVQWATRIASFDTLAANSSIAFKTAGVMALTNATGGFEIHQRIFDIGAGTNVWRIWNNFTLDSATPNTVTPAGYSARIKALYGTLTTVDAQGNESAEKPFFAALPAVGGTDVAVTELDIPAGLAESLSFVGELPTHDEDTARIIAQTVVGRALAWDLDTGGMTNWGELANFKGEAVTAITQRMAKGASETAMQGCTAVLGSVAILEENKETGETKAAMWALPDTNNGAIVNETRYAQPSKILQAGEQVGSFESFELDPTKEGNGWDATDPDYDGASVWQYAIYRGSESLSCDGDSCNKVYWNTAIGFDPTVAGCRLIAEATAASDPGLENGTTPDYSTYPMIQVDVALTSTPTGDEDVELVCRRNPLNGESSGVETAYTRVEDPQTFCHQYDGTSASSIAGCEWTPYTAQAAMVQPGQPGGGGGANPR